SPLRRKPSFSEHAVDASVYGYLRSLGMVLEIAGAWRSGALLHCGVSALPQSLRRRLDVFTGCGTVVSEPLRARLHGGGSGIWVGARAVDLGSDAGLRGAFRARFALSGTNARWSG